MSQNTETAVDVKASESGDSSESKTKTTKKQKRPDKPLYVPPGSKNSKSSDTESSGSQQKPDKDKSCKENNELSWDSLYDESGDVIDNEFVNELNSELEIRAVRNQLTATTLDYSKFTTNEWSDDSTQPDTGTILEVYDFVSDLKTRDLITSISSTNSKNFDIEWVDDTHCLIIFHSTAQASEALSKVYPNLKLRPISLGTKESQLKAQKRSAESKVPKKPRPETTTLLARRLVTGALGIKADMNPEQRKAEREKLRLAKEKKQQVQKQVKNIWDGDVS